MAQRKLTPQTRTNTDGRVRVSYKPSEPSFEREDFFRDLKKASRKQDRPSQRGSEKR